MAKTKSAAKAKAGWGFFWLSAGLGAVLALLAAPDWSINTLVLFAGACVSIAAYQFGWLRGLIRTLLLVGVIWVAVFWLGHRVRQNYSPQLLISTYKIMGVGRPPVVEIHFRSSSDYPIDAIGGGSVGVADCTTDLTLLKANGDLAFDTAKSNFQKSEITPIEVQVPPHASMHVNLEDAKLTSEKMSELVAGTACFYFAGFFDYKARGVQHETPFCGFSTSTHDIPNCLDHNKPY